MGRRNLMGMQLLAGTRECRNGNCPTVWSTEQGTVVVQGYIASPRSVKVPVDLIERAAHELATRDAGAPLVPAPRSPEVILLRAGEWFEVVGTPTGLVCPAGERAHEIPAAAVQVAAAALTTAEAV